MKENRDYKKEIEALAIQESGFVLDEGCGIIDGTLIVNIPADLFNAIFWSGDLRNELHDKIMEYEPCLDVSDAELDYSKIIKISAVVDSEGKTTFQASQERRYYDISEGEDIADRAYNDYIEKCRLGWGA